MSEATLDIHIGLNLHHYHSFLESGVPTQINIISEFVTDSCKFVEGQ